MRHGERGVVEQATELIAKPAKFVIKVCGDQSGTLATNHSDPRRLPSD